MSIKFHNSDIKSLSEHKFYKILILNFNRAYPNREKRNLPKTRRQVWNTT